MNVPNPDTHSPDGRLELVATLPWEEVEYTVRSGLLGHAGFHDALHLIVDGPGTNQRFMFEGVVWLSAAPAATANKEKDHYFFGVEELSIHRVWHRDDQRMKAARLGRSWGAGSASYIVALPGLRWKIECTGGLKMAPSNQIRRGP
jgi:hypothetical protein